MDYQTKAPFESIESAHEYLTLLLEVVLEAGIDVEMDLSADGQGVVQRRAEALQLVLYNLKKLESHLKISRRVLNDLRTLRRLLGAGSLSSDLALAQPTKVA